jgi:hypothetical protein
MNSRERRLTTNLVWGLWDMVPPPIQLVVSIGLLVADGVLYRNSFWEPLPAVLCAIVAAIMILFAVLRLRTEGADL